MKKTSLAILTLFVSADLAAATARHRIINIPAGPQATLSGHVLELASNAPAVQVEVEGPRRFAQTDAEGKFKMQLQIGQTATLKFTRAGYETLTETVTVAGNESREFRLTPLPTARVTTTAGTNHAVVADTVEFGWMVPFSGYRHGRSATMCRPGGGEFVLDRVEIDRVEGPGITVTDSACCTRKPLTGAVFELASGERITAYFMDSCDTAVMEVIARDHATFEFVFVPLTELREVVMP